MSRATIAMLASLVAIIALFFLLSQSETRIRDSNGQNAEPIMLYCAASNRNAMEAVRTEYEKEFKRAIQIQYGPSQTLLSTMEVSGTGDLYLPADDSFLKIAGDKKLIAETIPVAEMKAVIAVKKGNPKGIHHFQDLLRPEVRVVQAGPDSTAIGKITRDLLQKSELWDKLDRATIGYRTTVNDAASDVVVGAADAAIVYDAVMHGNGQLESIELPELRNAISKVAIGVIAKSKQSQDALHFARYVTSKDRGLKHYAANGFKTSDADPWSDQPELNFYAGSMLRPAIEETLIAFEKREGVRINRVYNGCGILVAQMKAGQHPDAYFACDKEFMKSVPDIFPTSVDVSSNQLVILVKKGNPHGIELLRDLAKPNLRVGVGHEKQCAMGWLTQNTLREGGVLQKVMNNVTVQSPTGDMLVNQLQAGSLDAAIAYLTNAAGKGDFLDAIQIDGIPCAIATQPFGIANDSKHTQIANRLFQRLNSEESKENFVAQGFVWKAESVDAENKGKHE